MLKRFFFAALFALTLLLLFACSAQGTVPPDPSDEQLSPDASGMISSPNTAEKKLSVVCTAFPVYDWVRNILGTRANEVELTYLLESGTDMHSYQPSADDMVKIASCDLFVHIGGTSDVWVADALRGAVNEDMVVLSLMDVMLSLDLALPVAPVMGMQEHAHEGSSHAVEYDEHIWLSPVCAAGLVAAIGEALCAVDEKNAALYRKNCADYSQQLSALDKDIRAAVGSGTKGTVLIADRYPFRYLIDEYDIACYAAFDACSAETSASFETIVFLASKVDELGLSVLLTTESSDGSVANTIAASTAAKDQAVLALDSMQSVTRAQVEAGTTYLGVMRENLEVLRLALA